jgi:hypothetical protein
MGSKALIGSPCHGIGVKLSSNPKREIRNRVVSSINSLKYPLLWGRCNKIRKYLLINVPGQETPRRGGPICCASSVVLVFIGSG